MDEHCSTIEVLALWWSRRGDGGVGKVGKSGTKFKSLRVTCVVGGVVYGMEINSHAVMRGQEFYPGPNFSAEDLLRLDEQVGEDEEHMGDGFVGEVIESDLMEGHFVAGLVCAMSKEDVAENRVMWRFLVDGEEASYEEVMEAADKEWMR